MFTYPRRGFSMMIISVGLLLHIFSGHGSSATAIGCGSITSGSITSAGQVNQYTYTAQAGGIVTLTLVNTGGFYPPNGVQPSATLFNPTDKVVLSFHANSQQQVTFALTGMYLLQIDSNDLVSTGTYNLGVDCRNPLQPTPLALSCGGIVNGKIAASAQVDQYTYAAQAGGIVTLTLVNTGGFYPPNGVQPSATLFDPSGKSVLNFHANSQVTFALTGTYLLQIDSNDLVSTGTYNLGVDCRNPLQAVMALSCGSLVGGKISASAQVDQYAHAGQAGGIVVLTLANTGGFYPPNGVQPSATLFDPSGTAVLTFAANSQKQVTLTWTGTYLIQLNSNDLVSTGTYNLGVECLTASGDFCVPVTPCRVADTRPGSGFSGAFGAPSMTAGATRSFPTPSSTCGIPSYANAYSLNVTAVPSGSLDYLSIWPTGELQPLVSTINSPNGQIVANAALVPAGSNGGVDVYVTDNTDVIIDIDGYFVPQTYTGAELYTVTPCRIADTRAGSGLFGGPSLSGGARRAFPILSSTCSTGVPPTAEAYSLNLTVVPPGPLEYLSVWPEGQSQPTVSTLNALDGRVVANAALVPAGAPNGGINLYASNNTDAIIDINGYFGAPATGGLHFYPVSPCRVADTRASSGFTGAFGPPTLTAGSTRTLPIPTSTCGIPSTAQAYSLNMTVVPSPGPLSYLTAWPYGTTQTQPVVSTLNWINGSIVANAAIVPAGTSGSINVYVSSGTDVIVDIDGYFAP